MTSSAVSKKFAIAVWGKAAGVRGAALWLARNKQFNQRSEYISLTGCDKEFKLGSKSNT